MPLMILPPYYTPLQQAIAAIYGFDPYFEYVSFLSHFEGANGDTSFTATKGDPIAAVSGATLATTDYKFGSSSLLNTPTGKGFTTTSVAKMQLGSTNFTIEGWFKCLDITTGTIGSQNRVFQTIMGQFNNGTGQGPFYIYMINGSLSALVHSGSTVCQITASGTVPVSTWNHFAFVRSGATLFLYLNGASVGTYNIGTAAVDSNLSVPVAFGADSAGSSPFNGYIDDIRVTTGIARYTGSFVGNLPTTAFPDAYGSLDMDPWYDNVTVLMHGDAMTETHGRAVTASNAVVNTTNKRFGTGSLKTTNGYMSVAYTNTDDVSLGSQDFTVEAWVYLTAYQSINTIHASGSTLSSGNSTLCLYINNSGTLVSSTGGTQLINAGTPVPLNTWTHVAYTRNGSFHATWINGVQQGTANLGLSWNFTDAACFVGGSTVWPGNVGIDEFRMTKGVCRYTSNFVPRSFVSPQVGTNAAYDPYQSAVALQLSMEGVNGGTNFVDSMGSVVTATNVTTSTASVRAGSSSALFSAGQLTIPKKQAFNLCANDFTIEAWIKPTSITVGQAIATSWVNGGLAWNFGISATGYLTFSCKPGNGTATTPLVANAWQHVAVVRKGTVLLMFLGGRIVYSADIGATAFTDCTDSVYVGNLNTGGYPLTGYMDDLRITNGVARYVRAFVPDTGTFKPVGYGGYNAAHPNDTYASQVVAHLGFDGAGVSESTGKVALNLVSSAASTANTAGYINVADSPAITNGSLAINGSAANTYVSLVHNSNLNFAGDFTIECWLRMSTVRTGDAVFFDSRVFSRNGNFLTMSHDPTHGFYFYNNTAIQISSGVVAVPNVWYHIALVRSGSTVTLYVNGRAAGTCTLAGPTANTNWAFVGGNSYFGGTNTDGFIGNIDDFRITNGAARYTTNFTPSTV